jgi:hypothetical protein
MCHRTSVLPEMQRHSQKKLKPLINYRAEIKEHKEHLQQAQQIEMENTPDKKQRTGLNQILSGRF